MNFQKHDHLFPVQRDQINFKNMTPEEKKVIEKISKQFAKGFKKDIGGIGGSSWLIVDPLSGYLNFVGHENELKQMPECEKHPLVLIMIFKDGTQFIPAGGDLKTLSSQFYNWMWIDPIN
jgi:hypothetical protein